MTQTALPPAGSSEMVLHENPEASAMMPLLTIEQAITRYNMLVEVTKKVLRPGRDYGVIPGTERRSGGNNGNSDTPSSKNNTLLKPGAEKLCTIFGLVATFEDYRVIEDWDKGLFYYAFRCVLSRGGRQIASGIGSANSREKKYRRGAKACPECGALTIKRSRYARDKNDPNAKPDFYCDQRAGGCGRSFDGSEPRILEQTAQMDPLEAADQVNTLQKMAQKRALIAATLIATNASEFFTQDLEDMAPIDTNEGDDVGGEEERTPQTPHPLADEPTFMQSLREGVKSIGQDPGTTDEFLAKILNHKKITLDKLNAAAREELIGKLRAGKFNGFWQKKDQAQPTENHSPPPAQQSPPTPATASRTTNSPAAPVANEDPFAEVESWELFLENARTAAADVPEAVFDEGIRKALAMVAKTGKPETTSKPWRVERLRAIRNKAFDWETAKINQVQQAIG